MNIQYSFIIPHKNSLELLNRCINSIPHRDDIEIIVVDDNSDETQIPTLNKKNVRVIRVEPASSKGAGKARNEGLQAANGKWVIFADCDDTYSEGFIDILDLYSHQDLEVLYFGYHTLNSNGLKLGCFDFSPQKKLPSEFVVKYLHTAPWNKMCKREFLIQHKIRFEECPVGNDIFFTLQVGYHAKKYEVEKRCLYNYCLSDNSITRKKRNSEQYYKTIFCHILQKNEFFKFVGMPEIHRSVGSKLLAILYKKGFKQFLFAFIVFISRYKEIKGSRLDYVKSLSKK